MITATTNISSIPKAQAAMIATLKNPPKTPVDAFKWVSSYVNISSDLGKTISGLFPGAGSIIGSLTDIFSAFSSGPTLGQMVMDGLKSLSNQINDLKSELTSTIEKSAEIQTAKTVDYVLQGVDELQRQASAAQVMQNMIAEQELKQLAIKKNDLYTEYLSQYNDMQEKVYAEITEIINSCQLELENLYKSIIDRFGSIGFDLFKYFQMLTSKSANLAPVQRTVSVIDKPTQVAAEPSKESGFNPLLLSPLLLLLFMKKKK